MIGAVIFKVLSRRKPKPIPDILEIDENEEGWDDACEFDGGGISSHVSGAGINVIEDSDGNPVITPIPGPGEDEAPKAGMEFPSRSDGDLVTLYFNMEDTDDLDDAVLLDLELESSRKATDGRVIDHAPPVNALRPSLLAPETSSDVLEKGKAGRSSSEFNQDLTTLKRRA